MGWPAKPDVSDSGYPEASKWFRQKLAVPNSEWNSLSDRARQRAFSVGGVSQLDLIQDVWTAIDKAVATGTTLADFQADVGDKLAKAWGGADPYRLETVFRAGIQSAYNAGRYEQQNDPDVLRFRPFSRFSAILDGRTSECCRASHGTVLPSDHPWFQSHQPPLHHRCRSTIVTLTPEQTVEMGGETKDPTSIAPSPGFGGPPSLEWAPDIGKFNPELANAFIERQDVPPAPPPVPPEHTREHWTEHYKVHGYGHEAATSLGLGRAAQERGLDLLVADVRKDMGVLSTDHAAFFEEHLAKLPLKSLKKATLRDLLDDQTLLLPELDKTRIKALAALYGHASDLGDARATAKMFGAEQWVTRPTAKVRMVARQIVGQAVSRISPYLSSQAIPPGVEITWKAGRAYQSLGKIVMPAKADRLEKSTLEHEFGHAIETATAVRLRASDQFLEKRAGADVPKQLRALTGYNFNPNEYTHEDRFANPYVGKIYGRRGEIYGSEVTSMGLQWLTDPKMLVGFFTKDAEHFLFTIGQLAVR